MARKWIIAIGAGLVVVVIAVMIARRGHPSRTTAAATVRVTAEATETYTGRVAPRNIITVAAPVEGILESWSVEPGQEVIKDQLLGRVRVPKLEAAERQAQADLDLLQARAASMDAAQMAAKLEISRAEAEQSRARSEVDRLQKVYEKQKGLWDLGATPRLTFEKAQKDYNDAKEAAERSDLAAKAAADRAASIAQQREADDQAVVEKTRALEKAKADLGAGDLHAPADGMVIVHKGQAGEPVDPSVKDLLEIGTELTQLQVTIAPSPSEIARMRAGGAATVRLGDDEFSGTVREIRGQEVIVDFSTSAPVTKLDRTAQVRIKF